MGNADLRTADPPTLLRVFDVRRGEGGAAFFGLTLLLLLIIAAHTILETARDALLLTGPGPRALGTVYVAIAACAVPASALAGRAAARFGARRALAVTLGVVACAPAGLFLLPDGHASAIVVYVTSGVIASVVVPQFWTVVSTAFTSSQGRRLFGLIAAGGVAGGVAGSGAAALAMLAMPTKVLLILSAVVFALAGGVLLRVRVVGRSAYPGERPRANVGTSLRSFRDHTFLVRIALLVFLSTATLLALDYLFKSSVARALPPSEIGPFVARYYFALNLGALAVQLFVGSAVVRRLGVAAAMVLTPLLLSGGAAVALLTAGALLPVLVVKALDGSLRHSMHRMTGELVYLPIPLGVRQRVKPLIDGALARAAQTITGASLVALGGTQVLSPGVFAGVVVALAAAWLAVAFTSRRSYLELLRHAISSGPLDAAREPNPIDLESAEVLVQYLASEDPLEVVGAMNALARRKGQGLISALVLLHHDDVVLSQALEIFAASSRTDWIPLATRLLEHPRDPLRIAAARALAIHGQLDAEALATDRSARVRGYAVVHLALRSEGDVRDHPLVASLMGAPPEERDAAQLGMLAAIADAPPSARLSDLLLALGGRSEEDVERTELLARAAERQGDARMIPHLLARLSSRAGREAVRAALVALGEGALDAVWQALRDATQPRRLRAHLPKTIARFGSARAAARLVESIEHEHDGLVRYKSVRALEVLVDCHGPPVDRTRVLRLCHANLVRHFRILALRVALDAPDAPDGPASPPRESTTGGLLVGLLDDKLRQSLDRAFRLLKITYPGEDLWRVYRASSSPDPYARANAAEFMDTLLRRHDQQAIRSLLRIVADDLSVAERVRRAAPHLPHAAVLTRDEALAALVDDPDATLAALASLHALEVGSESLRVVVEEARRLRPDLDPSAAATGQGDVAHG